MATIARAFSRLFFSTSSEFEFDEFKTLALFCAAGLLVTLLMLTYGIDLSPGFF